MEKLGHSPDFDKLVSEATACLRLAGLNEMKSPDMEIDIKTARSMFVNFYGQRLIVALKELAET